MSTSKKTKTKPRSPSERDQYWLDHDAAQAASGQTAKEYAAAQGLSAHAFYQARKRLRAIGLLAPPATRNGHVPRKRTKREAVSFSKVAVATPASDRCFRLEIPGGVSLEWAGGDVPESVAALLERQARQR